MFFLFAACSNYSENKIAEQTQNTFVPDSLWTPTGNAQIDSLLQLAAVAPQDTTLALIYFEIGELYINNDLQKAKEYYSKLKTLSERLKWNRGFYKYSEGYTDALNIEGLMDSAIVIHLHALELAKAEINERQTAVILINIGNCYYFKSWYETALKYYNDALPYFEKVGEKTGLAHIYSLIGNVYKNLNMKTESLMCHEKAVNLWEEKPDILQRANALINYSTELLSTGQFEKAEDALMEAQRISVLNNSKYHLLSIYSDLADIAFQKFDWDKNDFYAHKSLELSLEFGDVEGYCISNRALSSSELHRNNINKSEEYLMSALEMANNYDLPIQQMKCYKALSDIYIARHNYNNQIIYQKKADSIQATIISEQTQRVAKEMEVKYETSRKELEIERQQQIIAHQNIQRWFFISGIAVCVVILALLWYILRLRIRRNRTLADMNSTKDKFFSIISHDLKNPAVAQRDAINMLIKNAHLWDATTLTDFYNELLKSAEGGVELIYNLLGWAQVQTGRMIYKPDTMLLSDILPNISLIQKAAEDKGVILDIQMPENAIITCDSNMLATIIRNLLNNAVKFTDKGGTVTLDISSGTTGYIISINDTGIGMSKEIINNLFRLDKIHSNQGTAGETGSGLGLIVCKELLEKHGSKLNVESEEGKGSRFWFEI